MRSSRSRSRGLGGAVGSTAPCRETRAGSSRRPRTGRSTMRATRLSRAMKVRNNAARWGTTRGGADQRRRRRTRCSSRRWSTPVRATSARPSRPSSARRRRTWRGPGSRTCARGQRGGGGRRHGRRSCGSPSSDDLHGLARRSDRVLPSPAGCRTETARDVAVVLIGASRERSYWPDAARAPNHSRGRRRRRAECANIAASTDRA